MSTSAGEPGKRKLTQGASQLNNQTRPLVSRAKLRAGAPEECARCSSAVRPSAYNVSQGKLPPEVVRVKLGRLFAVLVLAVLCALLIAGPAAAATRAVDLEATLTGEQEVPGPGDRNGVGAADLTVYRAKVCYTLVAVNIRPPTAAHIHEGRRGVAGDIVVELKTPSRVADGVFISSGCEEISRALSRDLRMHPAHYYVNVHNNPFPAGAIRGQLHR
jgi:hypothetical protein